MDDAKWYYMHGGQSLGPVSRKALLTLLDESTLSPETQVWQQGAEKWLPLRDALAFPSGGPPPVPTGPAASSDDAENTPIPHLAISTAEASPIIRAYSDFTPHPWRRYFARSLDTLVNGFVLSVALIVAWSALDQQSASQFTTWLSRRDSRYVGGFLMVALAMFPGALLLGLTTTSLGKWIFGIRVSNLDGSPIGFQKALSREVSVWIKGMGFGIPFISLFTMISAYRRLKNEKRTSWDEALYVGVSYRPDSAKQMILNWIGVILLITGIVVSRLP